MKAVTKVPLVIAGEELVDDAAADVDAAGRHDGEGEVAGLGAVDRDEALDGGDGGRAGAARAELADHRRRVFVLEAAAGLRRDRHAAVLVEEGEDVGEPVPGDRALVGDVAVVLALEPAQELVLDLVARREVGVAALGRDRDVPRPVPEEEGLAETRCRRR